MTEIKKGENGVNQIIFEHQCDLENGRVDRDELRSLILVPRITCIQSAHVNQHGVLVLVINSKDRYKITVVNPFSFLKSILRDSKIGNILDDE
jgi:hypothetical protein